MPANPVTGLEAAITRGLRFLERHQLPNGEFVTHACQRIDMRDRAVYEPTVFTTTIVIRAISRVDDESVWCMTRRAVSFFLKEMPQPGLWGWSTRRRRTRFPLDVDDTASWTTAQLPTGPGAFG